MESKTITVEKHNISSSGMHHRENGIGAIEISVMHYDHTSELGHIITVWDETTDHNGWGQKIFEGTISQLIAMIYHAKGNQVTEKMADKAAAVTDKSA